MGKKRKHSSTAFNSLNSIATNNFSTVQNEIIQHLQSLNESRGLVIGCNEVLKGIEKNLLCVVILISKKATSAMYHALHLMCKDKDLLFIQLPDFSHAKILSSTAYGIKTSTITNLKLLEKINSAKSLQKSHKQRRIRNVSPEKEDLSLSIRSDNDLGDTNEVIETKTFIHLNHNVSKKKFIGNAQTFISLGEYSETENDFPNYERDYSNISICIQ